MKTSISLDVVNLHPSIPIKFGIDSCLALLESHINDTDKRDINREKLNNMLTFLCYKYEGITIRQTRGVPMGNRFAPPFANIVMHYIETKALCNISDMCIKPKEYLR